MSEGSDRIFVSIGVSKPGGGLAILPGAITAAERMRNWAHRQGYATVLVHDEQVPEVTVDLLREKIVEALGKVPANTSLKRMVFFFAGHGAALANGDQYWLLTNWLKRPTEAIKVSSLQRMLEYYGSKQVSIIGDACQEVSPRFLELIGSPVLDRLDEESRPYELDQFFAVDAGKQAFMIKASGDKRDFCLFTEVLLNALNGDVQDAFEEVNGNKAVTSDTLTGYLAVNVPLEAGKYQVRMTPRLTPGFRTDKIYMTMPSPPDDDSLPPLLEIASDVLDVDTDGTDLLKDQAASTPEPKSIAKKKALRGSRFGLGFKIPLGQVFSRTGGAPGAAGTLRSGLPDKVKLVVPGSKKRALDVQAEALAKAREASRETFVTKVRIGAVREHFGIDSAISVSGADVALVEASFGNVLRQRVEQQDWFRIKLEPTAPASLGWSDTLVTLADGRIVPVCSVQHFVAALHIVDDASLSLLHRPLGSAETLNHHAIELLAKAHAGLLSQADMINAANMMREEKHQLITLGCVAAQFYDLIRDVDSLRSMAAYYAKNHQPVPLDIVLYGGGTIRDSGGRLYADIPAVAAREPRTGREAAQPFAVRATPEFRKHPIAGRIPWMRQAWGAVATARCDASAQDWRRQAVTAMEYLAPGLFTIVQAPGREALCNLAGINVHKPEPEFATV